MGKKRYIKNSKGVTMSVTTDTLGLEKPLLNENYDIDVHNRNMDKIDEDLKPIDDSYIIELFQHDGDTTNPKDYYTKVEADEKFASKEEANNALNKANEAFQRGDNVKTQLVDKLISEGLEVSTNNTFEELISGIALGKKCASGTVFVTKDKKDYNFPNYISSSSASTSIDYYYATITGLNFNPSIVVVYGKGDTHIISVYIKNYNNYAVTYGFNEHYSKYDDAGYRHPVVDMVKSDAMLDNGIIMPINDYNSKNGDIEYYWIAFE